MLTGNAAELRLVMEILKAMRASNDAVETARSLALNDLQHLIKRMEDGDPTLVRAKVEFSDGRVIEYQDEVLHQVRGQG